MTDYNFDNLYDPNNNSRQNHTRTLEEIIQFALQKRLLEVHTCIPGQVTDVRDDGYVNAQPLLKRRFTNNSVIEMPIIQKVPVINPRGADFSIKLPVAAGDKGLILFAERSIDSWVVSGGMTDPQDIRTHDYSDAIFLPGLYGTNDVLPGAAEDMILTNGDARLFLQKAGKFLLDGADEELLDLIAQTAQAVSDSAAATKQLADACAGLAGAVLGGAPFVAPINAAGVSAVSAQGDADTIKGKVEDLTGAE